MEKSQTRKISAATISPYITGPVRCNLSTTAKNNIPKVHVISIDSYPKTSLNFYKHIKYDIQLPTTSYVTREACNPHVNYVMAATLGVNKLGYPVYPNIKVTFLPAITCIGTALETDLTQALKTAQTIAQDNQAKGINTVVVYPIGGAYNTTAKIQAVQALSNTPKTYVLMSSGNYEQANFCYSGPENLPNAYVMGATVNGSKLSPFGNIGACVRFYTPGKYRSVVDGKIIWGTSYSMPIAANIFINMLLANPDLKPQQIYAKVKSISKSIPGRTTAGGVISMNVFPKATVCQTNPDVAAMSNEQGSKKTMLTQYNTVKSKPVTKTVNTKTVKRTTDVDVDLDLDIDKYNCPVKIINVNNTRVKFKRS